MVEILMSTRILILMTLLFMGTVASATTIEVKVNGLVCGFCAQGIEKTFRKKPETADVFVSLETRLVAVTTKDGTDISDADIRKALTDAGYDVKGIERTTNSLATLRARTKETQK
jgi:copper chaperone CopZ